MLTRKYIFVMAGRWLKAKHFGEKLNCFPQSTYEKERKRKTFFCEWMSTLIVD